jgi:hypothetical protein
MMVGWRLPFKGVSPALLSSRLSGQGVGTLPTPLSARQASIFSIDYAAVVAIVERLFSHPFGRPRRIFDRTGTEPNAPY